MNHHIKILSALMIDGKVMDTQNYLSRLEDSMEGIKVKNFCKNPVINCVLSILHEQAEIEGILTEFKVDFFESTYMDSLGLGLLIANALENVIHACSEMTDKEKKIMNFRFFREKLIFRVINLYKGSILFDKNGVPMATKEGHRNGC